MHPKLLECEKGDMLLHSNVFSSISMYCYIVTYCLHVRGLLNLLKTSNISLAVIILNHVGIDIYIYIQRERERERERRRRRRRQCIERETHRQTEAFGRQTGKMHEKNSIHSGLS